MAGEVELGSGSLASNSTSTAILEHTHFNYPWILLIIFLVAFAANSILTSESSTESVKPTITGPGGKPLPQSMLKTKEAKEKIKLQEFSSGRRLLFLWTSIALIGTFVGNAVNIIAHALVEREEGWWCGESTAVSCILQEISSPALTSPLL